jgi:hypothetical protein
MSNEKKIVISASRRTDIPAFYMDWFMAGIQGGVFEVINPYNRRVSRVAATPDRVHTVVFWSKNFSPFLKDSHGETLLDLGYHLYFSFTLNTENVLLEPGLPPLAHRLRQLETLCSRFSPEWIDWRFDPICFYSTQNGIVQNNLRDFQRIADTAARLGVRRCITSFMDRYKKIDRRVKLMTNFAFLDPPLTKKQDIIRKLQKNLADRGIGLSLCCEGELLESLGPDSGIRQSACIPNNRLLDLFGGELSMERDKGQRVSRGCGCRVSVDIGSYSLHPCFHNCLFCYANPAPKPEID